MNMATSEADKRANAKYKKAKYDQIQIRVPKGRKEELKTHAEKFQPSTGEIGTAGYTPQGSLNSFIIRAIDETVNRDKEGVKQ
jgi:hypothetical protein